MLYNSIVVLYSTIVQQVLEAWLSSIILFSGLVDMEDEIRQDNIIVR